MQNSRVTSLQAVDERPHDTPAQFMGRIEGRDVDAWRVVADRASLRAQKAASCLLRPREGDRVLVATCAGETWILAVLERAADECGVIETDGPMHLRSRTGSVRVEAQESLQLKGHESVEIDSPRLGLRTGVADLVASRVAWACDRLDGSFRLARVAGDALERIVRRFSATAVTSMRQVQRIDQVRSGDIDYRADNNYVYRGRNVLGKARDLAKMDADQIHMG